MIDRPCCNPANWFGSASVERWSVGPFVERASAGPEVPYWPWSSHPTLVYHSNSKAALILSRASISIAVVLFASLALSGCADLQSDSSPWAGTPYNAQPEIRSSATTTFAPVPTLGEAIRVRGDQSVRSSASGQSVLDLESLKQIALPE